MNRSDELDLLSADTHALLADTSVTFVRNRPVSTANPDTRGRTLDAGGGPASVTVAAVEADAPAFFVGGKPTRRRRWTVLAADVGFVPARLGVVRDAGGRDWKIVEVTAENNAREYTVVGEASD